ATQVEAIPLLALGQQRDDAVGSEMVAQRAGQERGRGDAVRIIIAEDSDGLLGVERLGDALGGLFHVWQLPRRWWRGRPGVTECAGSVGIGDATGMENARDERVGMQRGEVRPLRDGGGFDPFGRGGGAEAVDWPRHDAPLAPWRGWPSLPQGG